jgi:tetraacyldisaccharide 4'-kinase
LVFLIARTLREKGHRPAVLTRGYKRRAGGVSTLASDATYENMGDEAFMLERRLDGIAVIVDPDRTRGAREAVKGRGADTVVLDDGFQQWGLRKDLEIVTIDATNPLGNRHLLPRGILRQPLSTLKKADMFVLTKTNINPEVREIKDLLLRLNPRAQLIEAMHCPLGLYRAGHQEGLIEAATMKDRMVALVCGIADPESFESLIIESGIDVGLCLVFPDHHHYTGQDLEDIAAQAKKKGIDTVITTEKDAVRLNPSAFSAYGLQLLVLRIELKIARKDEEGFFSRLSGLYTV